MKRLVITFLLSLYFLSSFVSASSPDEAKAPESVVTGQVVDAVSGIPIENASVTVELAYELKFQGWFAFSPEIIRVSGCTGSNGVFRLNISFEGDCWVFAFFDDPATAGVDYLPGFAEIEVVSLKVYNISFKLLYGASLRFNVSDFFFIEEPRPQRQDFFFKVSPLSGELGLNNSLLRYGNLYGADIGLDLGHVIVPASHPVTVELDAVALVRSRESVTHRIIIDEGGKAFNLTKGELMEGDLMQKSLEYDLKLSESLIQNVSSMLDNAEEMGLYVSEERKTLAGAELFLAAAGIKLTNKTFYECYADMRQAWLTARDVSNRISSMYTDAATAAVALVPFLAVNSVAIAFLLFERRLLKFAFFLSIFIALLSAISLVYIGFNIADARMVLAAMLSSAGGCLILPRFFREGGKGDRTRPSLTGAIASIFSIAKRNLMTRRFRSLLTFISIAILISCFISLTSFKMGHGFTVTAARPPAAGPAPSHGILVRKTAPGFLTGMSTAFSPLDPSLIEWLSQRKEVALIAPKGENQPSQSPVFSLFSGEGKVFSIMGVIGIVPSAESQATLINKIIERGRFLGDEDNDGFLISEEVAEKLGVHPGDHIEILGNRFRLVGIFDAGLLESINDLDGAPMLPKMLKPVPEGGWRWFYCDPKEVAIFSLPSALELPSVVLARVDIIAKSLSDISPLSRLIVLNLGADSWISLSDGIFHCYVGEYAETTGSTLIILLILGMGNIFSMMIGCVYERRREIFTVSTLGFNPRNVASLFIAEGLIVGFIAGGLGYILGLGSYRIMPFLPLQAEVIQKVSINWSLLAVALSIVTTTSGSAIPALKASILTTPSLTRKWELGKVVEKTDHYWRIHLPVRIQEEEIYSFFNYLHAELKSFGSTTYYSVENLRYREEKIGEVVERRLNFTFVGYPEDWVLTRKVIAENEVLTTPLFEKPRIRTAYLLYRGSHLGDRKYFFDEDAHAMASFVRKIVFRWYGAFRKPH